MVRINEAMHGHDLASWLWHIIRNCFLEIAIKFFPIKLLETVYADTWQYWVKVQLPLWHLLQVAEYVIYSL